MFILHFCRSLYLYWTIWKNCSSGQTMQTCSINGGHVLINGLFCADSCTVGSVWAVTSAAQQLLTFPASTYCSAGCNWFWPLSSRPRGPSQIHEPGAGAWVSGRLAGWSLRTRELQGIASTLLLPNSCGKKGNWDEHCSMLSCNSVCGGQPKTFLGGQLRTGGKAMGFWLST